MKRILFILLALIIPALLLAAEPVREWKSKSGKPITKASFDIAKDSDPETVFLLKDGKRFKVPFNKLSQEDQDYVTKARESAKSLDDEDDVILEAVEDDEENADNDRGLAVVSTGNQYALLIGVNEYAKPIKSLRFCVNDMKLLAECFQKIGVPKENIFLVTDESPAERRPTGTNIREQIELVTSIMGPNDQLTIAFSGHGAMVDGKSYLCPSDTNLDKKDSIISRDWAFDQLEKCKAKQKIFIIDACRDEVSFGDQKALSGAKTLEDPIGAETHGFILIASCDKTQKSWEHPELKHGVFTYFLAKGLSGEAQDEDGYVSIMNLFQYVSSKTKKYVYHEFNKPQVPTFRQGSEMTDFCLAYYKKNVEPSVVPTQPTQPQIAEPTPSEIAESTPEPDMSYPSVADDDPNSTSIHSFVWEGSTIVKFIGKETDVVIPKCARKIDSSLFMDNTSLKSVVIPEGITEIEFDMFNGCTSLTKVVIPESVEYIGNCVFEGCSALTSIDISQNVINIDDGAFAGCTKLKDIKVSGNNPNYKSNNGCLLSKSGQELVSFPTASGEFHIPDGITKINKYAFAGCSSLTSVTIPDSVTQIEDHAFEGCSSLTSVVIPKGVTKISYSSFKGCSSLTSVDIPESVTAIEGDAFEGCISLTSIDIPASVSKIWYGIFAGCTKLKDIRVSNNNPYYKSSNGCLMTRDGQELVSFPTASGNYQIPYGIKKIDGAFKGCSSLKSVVIPGSVSRIWGSFENCTALTSVVIQNGVKEIDFDSFENCAALTTVVIPDSVEKISGSGFDGCTSLTNWQISNYNQKFKRIKECLLSKEGVLIACPSATGKYTIPYGVKGIDSFVFNKCNNLTSVEIPESVTSIDSYAFSGCKLLEYVIIPKSVTKIGREAFKECTSLKSVTIPGSVTEMGSEIFKDCSSLAAVTFLEGCTKIKYDMFENCYSLKSVKLPYSITGIDSNAFINCCSLNSIQIPKSVTKIGSSAFAGCSALKDIQISEDNPNYKSELGCIYSKDGSELISFPTASGKFEIPRRVKRIEYGAFNGCNTLSFIAIPDSVTEIKSAAFEDCSSLTSVEIPSGVTEIHAFTFNGCTSLASIVIPDSVEKIDYEYYPFCGCVSLKNINISNNNPNFKCVQGCILSKDGRELFACPAASGNYIVPDGVTVIKEDAFHKCSYLKSVIISGSVIKIEKEAFYGCKSLRSVKIPYSVTEIGEDAFYYCDNLNTVTILSYNVNFIKTVFNYNPDLVIRAPSGSSAEIYAEKRKHKFEKLEQE